MFIITRLMMKSALCISVILTLVFSSVGRGHDSSATRIPIDHLLQIYSENNGVRFVIDPRVKGFFKVIGLDINGLTQGELVDMLLLYNFIPVKKDDIVYVVPLNAFETRGNKIGQVWDNRQQNLQE